jgi:GDSL-like lipase/acylhydrolase family protein
MTPITVEDLEQAGMMIPNLRWEDEIARLEALGPAKPGGILFVGDSDFRFWNIGGKFEQAFGDLPATNVGFGGARIWETLLHFHRVVLPHRPRTILYLAGDNDLIGLGDTPEAVRNVEIGFRLFLDAVEQHLPSVERLIYLALHAAPGRADADAVQANANARLKALCDARPFAELLDYTALLYDTDGQLRPEAFRPDGLHFSDTFYDEWAAFLRPLLQQ